MIYLDWLSFHRGASGMRMRWPRAFWLGDVRDVATLRELAMGVCP